MHTVDGSEVQERVKGASHPEKKLVWVLREHTAQKYLLRKLRVNVLGNVEIHFRKSSFLSGEKWELVRT